MSLDKYKSLIDATIPYNGERFSGWYNTHDCKGFSEEVKQLEEIGHSYHLVRYPTACWLNCMKGKGASIERHQEGYNPGDTTIVLFLNTLDEDSGGWLQVEERDSLVTYVPIKGKFAMFPSEFYHHVTPLNADIVRISIAALFYEVRP